MNSSTILKRTLPLVIIILLIIGIAVVSPLFNKEKAIPEITNKDGLYFEVEENGRKYTITNNEIYETLKASVGLSVLLESVDKDVLNSGSTKYYDSVTQEEINEEIKKAKFPQTTYPNGSDDLDEEELAKAEETFTESMYLNNGLRNTADINNYYRLVVARRNYSKVALDKLIEKTDKEAAEDSDKDKYFTDKEIENYYNSNYLNGYWTVVVPFNNKVEAETILEQLGIKVHVQDSTVSGDFTKWVKAEQVDGKDVPLTGNEIKQAFIDLYNARYSSTVEGYPTTSELVKAGVEYTVLEDGKIKFNNTKDTDKESDKNRFFWTNADLKAFQSEIQNFVKVSLNSLVDDKGIEDSEVKSGKTFYTPQLKSYNNSSLFVYILKIAEEAAPKLEDVRAEIIDKLKEAELTDNYISKAMAELREELGTIIYDKELELDYINRFSAVDLTLKETKESSNTVIAKVNGKDYTANDLFKLMDYKFGMTIAVSELNYLRLLNNQDYNKIYDYYTPDLSEGKRVISEDKWNTIRERSVNEKRSFASGAYAQSGYAPTYGWTNFLRDYYGIASSEELPYYFLYSEILNDYAIKNSDVTELDENSDLWKKYVARMEEIRSKYFNVTGIHLLVSVNDEKGQPTDPETWTALQKELALDIYKQVWNYYSNATGTASEKLKKINDEFEKAPRFLAGRDQSVLAQPTGFDYEFKDESNKYVFQFSKAKSAGLSIKFEDLGSFTNGKMVKPFEEAVKAIWDAAPSSSAVTPNIGYDEATGKYNPIITEFGYHAYINLTSTDFARWDSEAEGTEGVLPTLQMVKTYLNDNAAIYLIDEDGAETEEEFTTAMKTAVTTYFVPLETELANSYSTTSDLYTQLKDLSISFKSSNYTMADFKEFIDLRVKSYQSNLVYFGDQE